MRLVLAALSLAPVAFCDAVTEWNAIMRTAVRTQGAHVQSRSAAVTHLAMFEAVNSISKEFRPYMEYIPAAPDASAPAAVIAAAHRVLRTYVPDNAGMLDVERTRTLSAIPEGPAKTAGIAVGEAAADMLIARRANDGASTPVPYNPRIGLGYWQPTPPVFAPAVAVNWGKVAPFGLRTGDQFRPEPPPDLTSHTYARDYREVKEIGSANSTSRPVDRANIVRYMAVTSPTQVWNHVAVQLSAAHGLTLSENAQMFAMMNMAVADAAIAVFDAKYTYHFWRPLTAIRGGAADDNSRTDPDPAFESFIPAPAYPSYPSGFGALSNAARGALESYFGKRCHDVSLAPNPSLPAMNLQYPTLRMLTDDISDARVYGGIHFRFEQDEAEDLGERIARYAVRNHLRRIRNGMRDGDR